MDLAVKLGPFQKRFEQWEGGASIRQSCMLTRNSVARVITEEFSRGWARQFQAAQKSGAAFHAIDLISGDICGFCCFNAPKLGYYGPLGVAAASRGKDIGTGLTLAVLGAMEKQGFGYAIIHKIGPLDFYKKVCGSVVELP